MKEFYNAMRVTWLRSKATRLEKKRFKVQDERAKLKKKAIKVRDAHEAAVKAASSGEATGQYISPRSVVSKAKIGR